VGHFTCGQFVVLESLPTTCAREILEKAESWLARRKGECGARAVGIDHGPGELVSLPYASQYLSTGPLLLRHHLLYSYHAAYYPHGELARSYGGTTLIEPRISTPRFAKNIIARLSLIERRRSI
jgi:hypothetical protein